jgi:DNA mismatch repair protein MutS
MALIKEYFDLTKKYQDEYGERTILLMMVGSFFEVYGICDKSTGIISGSKISDFSKICELNVVSKNVTSDNIVMAGFKDIMIEKYLKKIQDAGFTAVVYVQKQDGKNITRYCAGIFSPGTYFQSDSVQLNNNVSCVWVHFIKQNFIQPIDQVVIGVANVDIFTGKTSIFQYKEAYVKNPTTFDELERFIAIYKPSELIFISNMSKEDNENILSYANINSKTIHNVVLKDNSVFSKRAMNCEKQVYQKEVLKKFYKMDDFDVFLQNFYENDIATQSFCFLLDFIFQHNPNLVYKLKEPIFENCSDRLILANHSLKQLNIIDDAGDYSGKYSSVLKFLNECLTPMGKRHFANSFVNPTTNIEFLQREYDIIAYLLSKWNEIDFEKIFKKCLSDIKDLSKWERQMFLKKINPKAFCILNSNIESIQELFVFLEKDEKIKEYLFQVIGEDFKNMEENSKNILKYIQKFLKFEIALEMEQTQNFEINFFNKGVNEILDKRMEGIQESEDQLEAVRLYLNNLIPEKSKGARQTDLIKIHETEKNSFSLICTSRRCKLLESVLPKEETVELQYVSSFSNEEKTFRFLLKKENFEFLKQSASNNFVSYPFIDALCDKISVLKGELKDTINNVFNEFVDKFDTSKLDVIVQFVTMTDFVFTKALLAKKYNYCKPFIKEDENKSFIKAKGMRHCLIEHLQKNEIYVANDYVIGCEKQDGVLLYGTNAVGKTSFIRAIGICVIMAQAGLFVPCLTFEFKPYKYIFTRIIGNDNIFKGLSTFAVEMSELRTILRLADKDSLILGDELCSGTENMSAISIFVAGIERLYKIKCSFIFATHLHEIVNFEEIEKMESVKLKHMEVKYDKERDMLIYDRKLKDGAGNNMYGLEVCKSLSLPEDFLEAAYQIRMKYNPESSSILSKTTSHFNAKKIINLCEKCETEIGKEVHHLQHQALADENGVIMDKEEGTVFHKNKEANLLTLCEKCHDSLHKEGKQLKKVKTSKGYKLMESGK